MASGAGDTRSQMSEICSMIRTSAFEVTTMVRGLSASLFRYLSAAASDSTCFRLPEAEFSMAPHKDCDLLILQRSRVTDGVPNRVGALRPFNYSLNINAKHELLFLRETRATPTRRHPPQRRSSRTPAAKGAGESTKENILAAIGCIFRKRQGCEKTGRSWPQRRAGNNPAVAQT